MTPTDLQTEMDHIVATRLGIMGFTDPKKTPMWASEQAEREANGWARINWPEVFAKMTK